MRYLILSMLIVGCASNPKPEETKLDLDALPYIKLKQDPTEKAFIQYMDMLDHHK